MTKKNRLVFMSKLIFFTEENELIKENLKIADLFDEENVSLAITARQATINILKSKIPKEYENKIMLVSRGTQIIDKVKELKEKGAIFGLIGIVNEDAIFSFNCKIPLFNPEAMGKGGFMISDKVKKYGLPIADFQNVIDCLKVFEIHKENYFYMNFNNFSVISLNNANTNYRPEEETRVKQIFETNLKGNKSSIDQRILLLLLFHLINEVTTNPYFDKVDYWGTFPSSNPDNTATSVSFIKEAVRVLINGGPKTGPEILIRISPMRSKHSSGSALRLTNKSDKDFETLIVNPILVDKIKGKVICIIDDYITNGYSAESAKHILLAAGAEEVIFLSFGKFGKKYYSTNYEIEGNVSETYSYKFLNESLYRDSYNGEKFYNSANDLEILNFADLV